MQAAMQPPGRVTEMSPVSTAGSEWSGVNNYGQMPRNDGPYSFNRADTMNLLDAPNGGPPNNYRPPPNGNMNIGPGSQLDPSQQRRPSESGSRGSSRAPSIANSRSSDGTISDIQSRKYRRMEAELFQHYTILKSYLKGGAQQPPRPNKARDKLLRLSPVQFHELSTDVFDELQRRQAMAPLPGRPPRQGNVPPFLQPRPDFHEKRNQARQKLSSLQTPRFKDLSTDVFCELERRFPQFSRPDAGKRDSARSQSRGPTSRGSGTAPGPNGFQAPPRTQSFGMGPAPGGGFGRRQDSVATIPQFDNPPPSSDYGRPMAKQFQSSTITPNKSTMVEDEDDTQGSESRYDRSSDAFGLESSLTSPKSDRDTSATSQSVGSFGPNQKPGPAITELQEKVSELENALEQKEHEIQLLNRKSEEDWTAQKQEMDRRLEEAQQLNRSLEEEIAKLRADQPHFSGENVLFKTKYLKLDQDHQALQEQLRQQREITDEVSRQGQMYLEEMRSMAESGGGNFDREERLHAQVTKLEEEVKEWKARYVKTKAQLRSIRASSIGLTMLRPDATRHGAALQDPNGLVKDVHVTKFQIAIDELLKIARSDNPTGVLDHMKTVVLTVRGVTSDVDAEPTTTKDDEAAKRRSKLKSKVSATANNLITASKNFASSNGLSPVSLLDAAASHLTAAVVDLIHLVKIRPTPPGELQNDDDDNVEHVEGHGYFDIVTSLKRRSAVESVYSALSTPSEGRNELGRASSPTHKRNGSSYMNASGLGIKGGYGTSQEEADLEDLKMYLEDQTDGLVQSITSLVDAIRNEAGVSMILNHINTIAGALDNVMSSVERTSNESSSYQALLKERTAPIISILQDCRSQLVQANNDAQAAESNNEVKQFSQKLPPLAFQVARETKELVSRIMAIEAGREEDFS